MGLEQGLGRAWGRAEGRAGERGASTGGDWGLLHMTPSALYTLFTRLKRGSRILFTICFFVVGCSDGSTSLGGPLSLSISAVTPVAVTDSLIVEYSIVGRSLLGMEVDYNDMQTDSLFFLGAQSAGGRVGHLYAAPGQYTISARVDDAVDGSLTEALVVTIDP